MCLRAALRVGDELRFWYSVRHRHEHEHGGLFRQSGWRSEGHRDCTGWPSIYVANAITRTVSVVAADTNTVALTFPVGGGAGEVAVTPDGASLYVTGSQISVIDAASNAIRGTIPVAGGAIALTPDGTFAYVTNSSDTVAVIDTASNTVRTTIALPDCGRCSLFFGCGRGPCEPTGIAIGSVPNGCAPCAGDCDRDGSVYIDELMKGVDIALGKGPVDDCALLDFRKRACRARSLHERPPALAADYRGLTSA